jgi:hypothetical protein
MDGNWVRTFHKKARRCQPQLKAGGVKKSVPGQGHVAEGIGSQGPQAPERWSGIPARARAGTFTADQTNERAVVTSSRGARHCDYELQVKGFLSSTSYSRVKVVTTCALRYRMRTEVRTVFYARAHRPIQSNLFSQPGGN